MTKEERLDRLISKYEKEHERIIRDLKKRSTKNKKRKGDKNENKK
ncbi:hypothetical protein [Turicibacter sanguinis]|nr:hypothetical protein [Turicibacter sanguinis]MDB8566258.1 hypothetical protein [Turicibacter sanguinis]MDB8568878.1 hypothetical protein [Turicibacter sanguinis]MDB8571759.1 hypothetical protein [Turicibacter sanguinis]MDB8580386.1 hypothetical protein [Turicibacter sanguinis]